MFGLRFLDFLPIFAQAQQKAPAAQDNSGAAMLPIYIAGFMAIFYFLMLRPQRNQEKKRREMIDAVKKNDRILTSGGIYGTVTSVDPNSDRIVVRIDDERGVKVAFSRSSVARVIEPSGSGEKASES